jgi:hypothetical protein
MLKIKPKGRRYWPSNPNTWYARNRDARIIYQRNYDATHPKKYDPTWYQANKEEVKVRVKESYLRNRPARLKKMKEWRSNNV